jgi:glutaredoxin 2
MYSLLKDKTTLMSNVSTTEELLDRTIAGWEAVNERIRRMENHVYDLLRRLEDMEAVMMEQFRDDATEISSVTASTTRYCNPPRK